MGVSPSFFEYVLEQMSESRRTVTHRRMFGAVGLYLDERFIGLIDDDRLFLKTDSENRHRFENEGSVPFQPYGEGSYSMSFFEVPVRVLEDRSELAQWMEGSWAAAGKPKKAKRRSRPARS